LISALIAFKTFLSGKHRFPMSIQDQGKHGQHHEQRSPNPPCLSHLKGVDRPDRALRSLRHADKEKSCPPDTPFPTSIGAEVGQTFDLVASRRAEEASVASNPKTRGGFRNRIAFQTRSSKCTEDASCSEEQEMKALFQSFPEYSFQGFGHVKRD
jgi:hypothetical protein